MNVRWRIFGAVLIPTLVILVVLWVLNTLLLGVFYSGIKTSELKKTTENVINNLESEDINDRILWLSNEGDINIRVIETEQFKTLFSTGEVFNSVTYGWEAFSMFKLYEEIEEDGGELVRYYSAQVDQEMPPENPQNSKRKYMDVPPELPEGLPMNNEEMRHFREHFRAVPGPRFFDNVGKHNDLLYAKIAILSDGTEVMVVADTRISPLDSTVKVLRHQLLFCSIITVIISLAVSFFVAKRISKPIEKINESAKVLAEGNFDVSFDGKGYREIEELNDTLNYASTELGKVEQLREELMANVSHDMRTPLTMIVGYGEMMRDIPGENNAENIQVIIDEANRLSEFVTSILDLSKLQNGMEQPDLERTDVADVVRKSVERYKKLVPDAEFVLEDEQVSDAFVMCDATKITQALHNLIDNAVNYANAPKRITVRLLMKDEAIRTEISDNGNGISREELPYIWDRYYKSDSSHRRNVVGSGIGLSIVKEILKKHHARFGVESEDKKGSTFWFELKLIK